MLREKSFDDLNLKPTILLSQQKNRHSPTSPPTEYNSINEDAAGSLHVRGEHPEDVPQLSNPYNRQLNTRHIG